MRQYIVDAFADKVFSGNPAAVCVMDSWLDEPVMQGIAVENNLSETAFAVREGDAYRLRWFTPGGEVELCGHATLATAYVVTRFVEPGLRCVRFDTLSGRLTVENDEGLLTMDFPSFELEPVAVTPEMTRALGTEPLEAYLGADLVCVLGSEQDVRDVRPDLEAIRRMDGVCLHVTAPGVDYDCVTRSFAPKCNVAEDPVCGRGHCHVIPYWSRRTGKTDFAAYQASARGGELWCSYAGARTVIRGRAVLFAQAEIFI